MHELSLCEGLVTTLLARLADLNEPGLKVSRVTIVAGDLHAVIPQNMEAAFSSLAEGTSLAGAKLVIEYVPLEIECENCQTRSQLDEPIFLCHQCGSTRVNILKGNELYCKDMEVETDEEED